MTASVEGSLRTWDVDRIVANIGFQAEALSDGGWRRQRGESRAELLRARLQAAPKSDFLLCEGFEQIREVFARITGRADLDLYRGLIREPVSASRDRVAPPPP